MQRQQTRSPVKFIYLFGVLRCFQNCTGHTMTGSFVGRENPYIQLIKVPHCKLPTNGKQLPAFPLEVGREANPDLRDGRRDCYHIYDIDRNFQMFMHA